MSRGVRVTPEQYAALMRRRSGRLAPDPPGFRAILVHADEPPPSKYGAKRTEYNGRTYDSKAESEYARRLDLRLRAGEIDGWRPQATVCVDVDSERRLSWRRAEQPAGFDVSKKLLRCRLDFEVLLRDGRTEFHEVKGYRVRDWKVRQAVLEAAGVPLVVVGA